MEKLSNILEKWSTRETNMIGKGKQCIRLWHVDDLNMLHVDSNIVSSVFSDIDAENGKIEK